MSKNKFIGLILMMLLSLTGIIWVQIVWIRNALNIRNDIFNRAVFAGLNDAANAIESNRKMNFFFDSPMSLNSTAGDVTSYLRVGSFSSNDGKNFSYSVTSQSVTGTVDSSGNIRLNEPVITRKDTTFYSGSGTPSIGLPQGQSESNIYGNNNSPQAGQGPLPVNRKDFIDRVRKRANEFQNMSDQMIAEVYQWEKTMALDNNEVNFALTRSFHFSGIEIPFEFAVIRDGKVQEGTFKKSGRSDFLKSNYMVQLFPDNILNQNLILSVIFPERTNYVLGSIGWLLGGSLLFSFIILATFALSLFFIIRQKKISEMKSDFLNNMTHEFKTPIATISLAADTITNPKVINDEASIRHFIGMIKKENSRMNKKLRQFFR